MCLQQYWNSSQPYKHISVPAFAELFKHHKVGQETTARLAQGVDKAALEKQGDTSALLIKKKYALSNGALFHACWQVRVTSVCGCVLCVVPRLNRALGNMRLFQSCDLRRCFCTATSILRERFPFRFVLIPTLVCHQNQTCTCHSAVQATESGGANGLS